MLFGIRTLLTLLFITFVLPTSGKTQKTEVGITTHDTWSSFLESFDPETAAWERAHISFRLYPKIHALYRVLPNQMLQLEEGTIEMRHMEMWNDLRLMVKEPLDTYFTAFFVYTGEGEATLTAWSGAFVYTTIGLKHALGINMRYSPSEETATRLLIHELGHALFRVTNGMNRSQCGAVEKAEITIAPLVAEFYAKYWEVCDPVDEEKRERSHVTRYASSQVGEDLADTWVSFILCSMPRHDDERIMAQKKRMMWNNAELVERREHMYRSLGAERIGAVRKYHGWRFCREY